MPALFEDHQVLLFTVGLQEPLSLDVQMQNLTMLDIVTSLVHLYERRNSTPPAAQRRPSHCSKDINCAPELAPPRHSWHTALPPRAAVAAEMDNNAAWPRFNRDEPYSRGHNRTCRCLFFVEMAGVHPTMTPLLPRMNHARPFGFPYTQPQASVGLTPCTSWSAWATPTSTPSPTPARRTCSSHKMQRRVSIELSNLA